MSTRPNSHLGLAIDANYMRTCSVRSANAGQGNTIIIVMMIIIMIARMKNIRAVKLGNASSIYCEKIHTSSATVIGIVHR